MSAERAIERIFMVADWIFATLCALMAVLFGAVGGMFSALTFPGEGDLGGHEWTISMAILWGAVAALFTAAALGMKLDKPWKWFSQAAPPIVFVVGFGLVQILFG